DALAPLLLLRRRRASSLDAAAQRIHEVDDVGRSNKLFPALFYRKVRLLLAQKLNQRLFVMVLELRRIEIARFGLEDMFGKFQHLARHLDVGDVVEIFLGVTYLVRITQRGAKKALAVRLERNDALALGHHHTAQSDHVLALHGIAD